MKEASTVTETRPHSAQWYQAMTLTERLHLLQQHASDHALSTPADTKKGHQRLANWHKQPPFHNKHLFTQRLEADGLTQESLLTLLAQPAEEIQANLAQPPMWLAEVLTAFAQQDPMSLAGSPPNVVDDTHANAVFLALKPLLVRGFARLQAGISALQQDYTNLPFDPQNVGGLLLPKFLEIFLNKPAKTLVLELNVARVQGRLRGETPEQRFSAFLQQFAHIEHITTLFEEYPVLARQLVEMIDQWVTRSLELLQRLCSDWDEICKEFSPNSDPGLLTAITEGAGDAHQGGRSVTLLTWSSGLRLVYKPRSLAVDTHFQELLLWLNAHGCLPTFQTYKLLPKATYGWCEFLTTSTCTVPAEIERFYQRMGGYLAILYILEGTDFHAENLLAVGEHPMFIDLESLFSPRNETEVRDEIDGYAYNMLNHSVRRIGLLPHGQFANGGPTHDVSGLVGLKGQLTAHTAATWVGQGSDEMHIVRKQVPLQLGNHRPTLQDEEIDTLEYEQSILNGFAHMYRLLLQYRSELLTTIIPRFAHDEIRTLLRPTQEYVFLQADSFHPNVLRDALDRERLFDRLWLGIEQYQYPHIAKVIAAERADLWRNDIPKFTTYPDSHDVFTSQGEVIPQFFPETSLSRVIKRIHALDEQELEQQKWIIQASFTCLELNNPSQRTRKYGLELLTPTEQATCEQFLAEAVAIGNRLHSLATTTDTTVGWLGLNLMGGTEWRTVPAGPDLYNGLSGIALFLAYLGFSSKNDRYTQLARATIRTLQTLFTPKAQRWQWRNVGALDGLGSLIYLFSHLGTLWHDASFYQEATAMVALIPELASKDEIFDLLSGSAGCIAALLSLYQVAPTAETLAAAVACGNHLLKHARSMPEGIAWSPSKECVPLTGMSHGTAGIALSLLRLAAVSQDECFHQAALEAIAYERSLFSPEHGNWPDLREATSETLPEQYKFMTAWCHGATGIGLARLASLPYYDDATSRTEISVACQTVLTEGLGKNHSLCHGDMGSLELLLTAHRMFPDMFLPDKLTWLQTALVASMRKQGWRCGLPTHIETPSLMLGLAGTGYALLRWAFPEQVPAILTLDPPLLTQH